MELDHEYIKVVNVQLEIKFDFDISPANLNDLVTNKAEITQRIQKAFNHLETSPPHFIIFPEYSYFEELNSLFELKSKEQQIIIISGTYISSELIPEAKIYFPDGTIEIVQKSGLSHDENYLLKKLTLNEGKLPNKLFTVKHRSSREINFLVLICFDFYENYYKFYGEKKLDLLFLTCYNNNRRKFYNQLEEFCCKRPSFGVYCNAAGKGFGNSAFFGHHEKLIHDKNASNGYFFDEVDEYENIIANIGQTQNELISIEFDINKPVIVRPYSVTGNNKPNIIQFERVNLD